MPNLKLGSATDLTVKLTIGAGVALQDPELWQMVYYQHGNMQYVKVQRDSMDVSSAQWVIPVDGATLIALQLYWDAIEPNEPEWSYPGKIEVIDESGAYLKGQSSSQKNPQIKTYQIGPIPPHGGSELETITAG